LQITLAVHGVLEQIDLVLKLVLELYLAGISSKIFALVSAVFENFRNWSCYLWNIGSCSFSLQANRGHSGDSKKVGKKNRTEKQKKSLS